MEKYGPLVVRILLAQLFIISGFGKITAFARTAADMASTGMPMSEMLLVLTITLEFGGGILLVLGWRARWIAAAFFGFTLLASLIFHPFWAAEPAQAMSQQINFMKNLATMGGMLFVVVHGPGPFALGRDKCLTETQGNHDS
jgi:putative oxidoreductase